MQSYNLTGFALKSYYTDQRLTWYEMSTNFGIEYIGTKKREMVPI